MRSSTKTRNTKYQEALTQHPEAAEAKEEETLDLAR